MVSSDRSGDREFGYQPALDGVRAIAVAMVLVFHLDLGFYSGGYLGVSVFFTLSGYLITSLLIRERARSGHISFSGFYLRRVRRLLPASLFCIGAVAVMASLGAFDRSGDLKPSLFGALFQVQNWVALASDQSYADLFTAPSPLDHFWSLAIEEQFYWIWPVAVAGIATLLARRGRAGQFLPAMLLLFGLTSISAPITYALWGADATYFATWTRMAEILAGAVLAAALTGRTAAVRTLPTAPLQFVGWLSLALVLVAGAVLPAGEGLAYQGALPLFALCSVGLIAGLQVQGPLRQSLAIWPLRHLGRISFGVYLYHWPVFVFLDGTRTGLDRWPLAVVRLAVTLALSIASFHLLERPIRERRHLVANRQIVIALAGSVACVALFVATAVTAPTTTDAFDQDLPSAGTLAPADSLEPLTPLTTAAAPPPPTTVGPSGTDPTASPTTADIDDAMAPTTSEPPGPTTTTELVPPRPVRMIVVGDSTAQALGNGIVAWSQERPDLAEAEVMAFPGCGLLDGGDRYFDGEWTETPEGCGALFDTDVPARIAETSPDLVVVVTSFWDATDHRWPDDGNVTRTPLDQEFVDRLDDRFASFSETALAAGAGQVVWIQYPVADYLWDEADEPGDDPARYAVLAESIARVADAGGGDIRVVPLAAWLDERGLVLDHSIRPDGVHFTLESATDLSRELIGPELIRLALS